MLKNQVVVGEVYQATISGKPTEVKIKEAVVSRGYGPNSRETTRWLAENLKTGREVTIKSAMALRPRAINSPSRKPAATAPEAVTQAPTTPEPVGASRVSPALARFAANPPAPEAGEDVSESRSFMTTATAKPSLSERLKTPSLPVDDSPHLIVSALAGTGKTTTLVAGVRKVLGLPVSITPSPQQAKVWEAMEESKGKVQTICFTAFNKAIKEELEKRLPPGSVASTMHSLGNQAVSKTFGRVNLESFRVQNIISEILERDIREIRKQNPVLIKATEDLVALCKQNLVGYSERYDTISGRAQDEWEADLDKLASHYEVELNGSREKVYDLVPKVLERCMDVKRDGCMDFNDMIWLPVVLNLPCFQYDILLWDEAQDGNKCQQKLAMKSGKRLILCGDVNQAIYGFAGADSESLPNMERILGETERGCKVLPLTVTRRCGKAIVEEAKKIVPGFEAHESNGPGKISHRAYDGVPFATAATHDDGTRSGTEVHQTGYRYSVQSGDMILCRVNAPLVSQCFRFLKEGRKAVIQGRDIGQGLIRAIEKLHATGIPDLMSKITEWAYREAEKESAKRNPSDQKLIAIQDRRECLLTFCEDAKSVMAVTDKISSVFTDNSQDAIRLSSIHRSKGLEAKRVFLLEPVGATVPHPMAKSAWQRRQELNLRYVAITRAIEELVYVK